MHQMKRLSNPFGKGRVWVNHAFQIFCGQVVHECLAKQTYQI